MHQFHIDEASKNIIQGNPIIKPKQIERTVSIGYLEFWNKKRKKNYR